MMLVTSNSSLTGAGPIMRGRESCEDFFVVFPIVTVPVLVAEDPRHSAQLARVVLCQPALEQQQVGGRVALVGGVRVPLHLGEDRSLEAVSDQQLEVGRLVDGLDVAVVVVAVQLLQRLLGLEH